MKKTLIVGTILLTTALLVSGTYFPNSPVMWLAGTSIGFEIIRAGLIVILAVLLFSHPPRALYLRYIIGAVAAALGVATVTLVLNYTINLFDMIIFIETAIIFGIEALEIPFEYPAVLAAKQTETPAK